MELTKALEAIKALIESEVMGDYQCEYEIEIESEYFVVTFPKCSYGFNEITLRVNKIDEEQLKFSEFSINIYEDVYEKFTAFDSSVKELWKSLLWRTA